MSIWKNLNEALGGGRSDRESDRYRAPSGNTYRNTDYTKESGMGRGGNHHEYGAHGLTERQELVLGVWVRDNIKEGADILDMNRNTFKQTVENAKEKLGLEYMSREDVRDWIIENWGYDPYETNYIGQVGDNYDAETGIFY